ncbi:CheR family methyltransferase [Anaeromicropila herbilytica]|uniref:protein-glutamate O-methyltransferase n=1 Tax=Anaeromicropila herbilytica TaxID=2785025 RepID=A0A7R7EKV1_9FIRM|nr:protein-glutamate O-methyltransferase CheR [Anaeromicropila herbilytica]BCN30560.1 chemotaxis protein CheR [Anaeromicropila herbilytica]
MISISDNEFHMIADFIKKNYGIHMKSEKKVLIEGRLHTEIENLGFTSFSEYYEYLIHDKSGKAVSVLADRITTNHTFYMREAEHFYFYRDVILPELDRKVLERDLRIWCSACSTGEEAYTLAMITDEYFGLNKKDWDAKILATDISSQVLEVARQGIYNSEKLSSLPKSWQLNYFNVYDDENYRIDDRLKEEVIFRRFNLFTERYPFRKKFHVIFCRNAMIYFDSVEKQKLIDKFYQSLHTGGYLFIGHSESFDRSNDRFEYIMPSVCRKI